MQRRRVSEIEDGEVFYKSLEGGRIAVICEVS
jgi:hypothetical protein